MLLLEGLGQGCYRDTTVTNDLDVGPYPEIGLTLFLDATVLLFLTQATT